MRLAEREIEAIRSAVRDVFGAQATVRVFGSRLDDRVAGGDLDLFVEVAPGQASVAAESALRARIEPALDDLKVDLVFRERGRPLLPIEEVARREGILL